MEVFTGAKKPASSMGRETRRRRPKDNIDLDMEDAERLGYGVHYGKFKADHPNTMEAHESRLYPRKKKKTEEEQLQARKVYEKVCPVCSKKFTTTLNRRIYCSDVCKTKSDNKKWSSNTARRKEGKA